MKLIDDKGRLFSKINVIDLLVILFLLGLTPILYYGYKIATYRPPKAPPPPLLRAETYQEFEIIFPNIPEKFLSLVNEGDKQFKNTSEPIAEIIKIIERQEGQIKLSGREMSDPRYEIEIKDFFNIKVLMKLLVTPVKNEVIFQGKPLKVNSEFKFSTDKYTLEGFIGIPSVKENPTKEMLVTVQINNLLPEIANRIKKGDKEILLEKNLTIAEIKEIIALENSKILRFYEGVTRQYDNPFYRDVALGIKLLATETKDGIIYKNTPVKIGNVISISTKKYSFSGTIVNILK